MNMQQLMMQAQKMKRELEKAKAALAEQEFKVSKAGLVTVTVLGNRQVKSIEIEDDGFEKDNKDMIQDMIATAINEAVEKVNEAEVAAIEYKANVMENNPQIFGYDRGEAQKWRERQAILDAHLEDFREWANLITKK